MHQTSPPPVKSLNVSCFTTHPVAHHQSVKFSVEPSPECLDRPVHIRHCDCARVTCSVVYECEHLSRSPLDRT